MKKIILKAIKKIRNILDFYFKNQFLIKDHFFLIKFDYSSRIRNCSFRIKGNNNQIVIGNNCNFSGLCILIEGNNCQISFGNNVIVNASKVQPTVINAIGANITIGNNCLFSNSIEIHTSDYHGIYDQKGQRINYEKDIVIENHVWVGLGCTILKGARISSNSVVGAKTLISKKFTEENVVIAGSPATIIKHNITWDIHRNDCLNLSEKTND